MAIYLSSEPYLASANTPNWTTTTSNPSVSYVDTWVDGSYSNAIEDNRICNEMRYRTSSTAYTTSCVTVMKSGILTDKTQLRYRPNNTDMAGLVSTPGVIYGIPNTNTAWRTTSVNEMIFHTNVYKDLVPQISTTVSYSLSTTNTNRYLTTPNGTKVIVNPNTISYSENGRWMVVGITSGANSFLSRVDLSTFEIVPFGNSVGGTDISTGISNDGKFAAAYSKNYTPLTVYDVSTCGAAPLTFTRSSSCQSRDINSAVTSAISGYINLRRIRFDSNSQFSIKTYRNSVSGVKIETHRVMAPNFAASSNTYMGLGDSFSSGEGAGSYLRGTDGNSSNKCHTSVKSYPYRIAEYLGSTNSSKSIACSGALTANVTTAAQYPVLPSNNLSGDWLPGYKTQLQQVENLGPNLVTMSMGGNDVGFDQIVSQCIKSAHSCYTDTESRKELAERINKRFYHWVKMYESIKAKSAPGSQLYVIGYPQIAYNGTGHNCDLNVHLTSSEIDFSNKLIAYINFVISQATLKAGVVYVNIENSLNGSRLCEADGHQVSVNGLTLGTETNIIFSKGSYHPNALGQKKMYDTIKAETSNFTQTALPPSTSIVEPTLVTSNNQALDNLLDNTTSSPRPLKNKAPLIVSNDRFIQTSTEVGQTLTVNVNGMEYGLKPNTTYTGTLYSTPTSLGMFTTDANGDLVLSAIIPTSVDPGIHTLSITGTGVGGESIELYTSTYVAGSSNDYDGDSITNSNDSCPYLPNSLVDTDDDGIDDGCDGNVGLTTLYRARIGDVNLGEEANKIYIERNVNAAAALGITDHNPSNTPWVVVGKTSSSDKASSQIANFTIEDTLEFSGTPEARYKPLLSTRTSTDGCVTLTLSDLSELTSTDTLSGMSEVALNSSDCRAQAPGDDVNNNSIPDNEDDLYRSRNGNTTLGEDSSKIYIERNIVTAEAALGISDYDADNDGWALVGITDNTIMGQYYSLALLSTSNTILNNTGALSESILDSMDISGLRAIKPQTLIIDGQSCQSVIPTSLSVVTQGYSRTTDIMALLTGQSCS